MNGGYLLFALAVFTAGVVSWSHPRYHAMARLLALGLLSDALRRIVPADTLVGFCTHEFLYLGWSFAVVDLLLSETCGTFRGAAVFPWATVCATLFVMLPIEREPVENMHRALHGLAGVIFVVAALRSMALPLSLPRLAALLLGVTEPLLVIGPYTTGHASRAWPIACWIYGAAFLVLTLMHGGWLWRHRSKIWFPHWSNPIAS
jgi:hypothetical protein